MGAGFLADGGWDLRGMLGKCTRRDGTLGLGVHVQHVRDQWKGGDEAEGRQSSKDRGELHV